jgi:MFS superfamily sulfate permease-like transporter
MCASMRACTLPLLVISMAGPVKVGAIADVSDRSFGRNLLASVVVFLVALPLCMGIAIASGVPPALGLVTGIVGGLVVGFLAGSPLQVSGPAAGLAVIVWEEVHEYGIEMLGVIVLGAGVVQLLAGVLKVGRWFRAVSPAVIRGMLGGIGVLIFASQFHVMVDDKPGGSGLHNLMTIPGAIWKGLLPVDGTSHHLAAYIGVTTIASLVLWNRFKPKRLRAVPGPLVAVVVATGLAAVFDLPIQYVSVPADMIDALNIPTLSSFSRLAEPDVIGASLAMAVIASAESLLCATAVDKLHNGERTRYDRELVAQGVGNLVCGALGALPMTGVIVRSSANVEAGGTTRVAAIAHGAWLLALVVAAPFVLEQIPTAALAAILVYTGYKLVNPASIKQLLHYGWAEVGIYAGTLIAIVATDLLKGVVFGLVLAVVKVLAYTVRAGVETTMVRDDEHLEVRLTGVATFLTLPRIADELDNLPSGLRVEVLSDGLRSIDQAIIELIVDWKRQYEGEGGTVTIDVDALQQKAGVTAERIERAAK